MVISMRLISQTVTHSSARQVCIGDEASRRHNCEQHLPMEALASHGTLDDGPLDGSAAPVDFDLGATRLRLWQGLTQLSTRCRPCEGDDSIGLVAACLANLQEIERHWAYPGAEVMAAIHHYLESEQYSRLHQLSANVYRQLQEGGYRQQVFSPYYTNLSQLDNPQFNHAHASQKGRDCSKNYFEVLIVHPDPKAYEALYRSALANCKSERDEYLYDIFFVNNAEEALACVIANSDIQACVYVDGFEPQEQSTLDLKNRIAQLRPEFDHYYLSLLMPEQLPADHQAQFDRILFHQDPFHELHQNFLSGIRKRYNTPFFHALTAYSQKPKSVFHALPVSQGKSVSASPWTKDFYDFYGANIFNSETSSTQGGLDSLLDPKGAIKQAHDRAAVTFGAKEVYFVTNGTSTSNKIVMQAHLCPGDIVLVSSDCHKSVPYAVMLSGAYPIFLETYPLADYDLYGAVPLERIKTVLLHLKHRGQLHRVKQIILTNSTFDGLIYNVERFMLDILAIKPDIIFHWDEAWHGFTYFHWLYSGRTAMGVANRVEQRLQSDEYREFYRQWRSGLEPDLEQALTQGCDDFSAGGLQYQPLFPDPEKVVLRVYATQSTHKTLTSFRQGSMILVHDQAFKRAQFLEAFRIHTSTSPNYQILASLDIGRRQMDLEGYKRVQNALELAHYFSQSLAQDTQLQRYFSLLRDEALIPACWRENESERRAVNSWPERWHAEWQGAQFSVDPTRITLDIRKTGMDGVSFRQLLISRYSIQINKTSAHTAMFMINIGADRSEVDYLLQVLREIADRLQGQRLVNDVTSEKRPLVLPQQRVFHTLYNPLKSHVCAIGDMRTAYYDAYDDHAVDYLPLSDGSLEAIAHGRVVVCAAFITPYPPGYPLLVPGQIITADILLYLKNIKVKEVHGYEPQRGLKVFSDAFIQQKTAMSLAASTQPLAEAMTSSPRMASSEQANFI